MRFPLNIVLLALHATSAVVASASAGASTTTQPKLNNMTDLEFLDFSFNNTIQQMANLTQLLTEELDKSMNALNTMIMLVTLELLMDQQKNSNVSSAFGDMGSMFKGSGGSSKGNKGRKRNSAGNTKRNTHA